MKLELLHQKPVNSNGKSLLFIHGMWHGAWCWEPYFMPYFSDLGYDTYALSFRNHGESESEKPIWRVRIKDYVEDIKKTVNLIQGEPILVGHSMGGFVIQKYLEKNDVSVTILLASVPPSGIFGATLKVLRKYPLTFLKANMFVNLKHIISDKEKAKALLFSPNLPEIEISKYHSKMESEAYIGYLDMMGLDLPKIKKTPKTKMLVLGAGDDAVVAVSKIAHTAEIYQAESVIIPKLAHDVMLDLNWEAAATEVASWLKNNT